MKKPRVEDFDPNATPTLASPLDTMPQIQAPPARTQPPLKQVPQVPVVPLERPTVEQLHSSTPTPVIPPQPTQTIESAEATVRPSARTSVRPSGSPYGRRTITRYAFEFFQDQIEALKEFSLDEKLRGEKGSMSEMVREALDAYIAKRRRTEAE